MSATSDNTTAHPASEYEREVRMTIPHHQTIVEQAIEVAFALVPSPARWLDTGCGPGRLVEIARKLDADTRFTLADPSAAMLELARKHNPGLPAEAFVPAGTDALPDLGSFDVITAILCHHYYEDPEGRRLALRRARSLLAPGGALIVVENVRAETPFGHAVQRRRWEAWQKAQGREARVIEAQLAREGTRFFPIRVSEHLALLGELGFASVELFYRAYGQAGFVAVAPA
ncbi:MAG: class I SAM-dependent methyltransferase [Byssovorax sp.]